ncbi:MAG: PQQ-binding-like beta-propeller repeat protein [Ignavibacteriaceae bacterium]|nr:PQQ-binding-like beta-propeller repeat protein [Ignavibacteriaceae bacterium]
MLPVFLAFFSGIAWADLTLLETIPLNDPQIGSEPWGVAVSSADHRVYVACIHGPSHLVVLDGIDNTILGRAPLTGPYPHGVEVNLAGDRVFVASSGGSVSIVDAETLQELFVAAHGGTLMDLCYREGSAGVNTLYVADEANARVLVLDAEDGRLLGTIPVGNYPYDICINRSTDRVYVTNLSDWTVSVIECATNSVIATIPVGAYPEGIDVDPGLNRIYVANRDDNTVSIIDGFENVVIETVPVGETPRRVAVDPVTHNVFVVNEATRNVSILTPGGPIAFTFPVGLDARGGACVDAVLGKAFITNLGSEDLTYFLEGLPYAFGTIRLRFTPGPVTLAPPVEGSPSGFRTVAIANSRGNDILHMDPEGGSTIGTHVIEYVPTDVDLRIRDSLLGAGIDASNRIVLLDLASGVILHRVRVGRGPRGVAIRRDRDVAYVANRDSEDLSVVDTQGGSVITTVPLGYSAMDVDVNETTDRVYVVTWWGLLWTLDGTTHEVLDSISLHGFCEPNWVAVDESRNLIYVTALNCNVLWIVDGARNQLIATLVLPDFPGGVSVNETIKRAYVCTTQSLLAIGPGHLIEDVLEFPAASLTRCAADPTSRRVYVSATDSGGGKLIVVLDGDPAGIVDEGAGSGRASEDAAERPLLALGSRNPVVLSRDARIDFELSLAAVATARAGVFETTGRLVRDLMPDAVHPLAAGSYPLSWDCTDPYGRRVPAGVYHVRAHGIEVATEKEIHATLRLVVIR